MHSSYGAIHCARFDPDYRTTDKTFRPKKSPLRGLSQAGFYFSYIGRAGVIFLLQPRFFLPNAPLSVLRSVGAALALSPRSKRCNIFPACPNSVGGEPTDFVGFCKQICRKLSYAKKPVNAVFYCGSNLQGEISTLCESNAQSVQRNLLHRRKKACCATPGICEP